MSRPTSAVILLAEIEVRLEVSGKTISRWIAQGVFPAPLASWPGGRRAWDRAAVDRWLSDRGVSRPEVAELATAGV